MEYLDQMKKEIRENWFKNHTIKKIEGEEGFQRISWGEKGTRAYQIDYVLSGNMVFVSGDLGDAVYSLTCPATLDNIKRFDLTYFTGKLTAHQRDKWCFDSSLARKQIKEYFLDWCDVDHIDQLNEDDKNLYEELMFATRNWSTLKHFQTAVFSICERAEVDWFDFRCASCIADCGSKLNPCIIAYWVGLKMIIEQLEVNSNREIKKGGLI